MALPLLRVTANLAFPDLLHTLSRLERSLMFLKSVFATAMLCSLLACSSNEVVRAPLELTIGQQLIDLKNAHTSGALSKAEYDQQRSKLIDNVK